MAKKDDEKTVKRPDANSGPQGEGRQGARNIKGEESDQSKERRKERGELSDTETVEHIRTNPTNRMPTKGTEMFQGLRDFLDPPKKKKRK